ncbi:hypothetical protein TEA_007557 [Camellia sinensis var. sinensis]|uniref:Uncharacterized protein n=1 Tax=Camellia sinensis var. sinensis TaxID=542762 RepID=A0A4S4D6L8_CAMSN|nr:hypothetical protein TEA_007557 [Camellia sinensis var. sinensis]
MRLNTSNREEQLWFCKCRSTRFSDRFPLTKLLSSDNHRFPLFCSLFHLGFHATKVAQTQLLREELGKLKVLQKGLVDKAVEFGSFFEKTNTTMEEIAHKIGYAHDLSQARKLVNGELVKFPLNMNGRLRATTLIVQDAERVDLFFSLPKEDKMEWVCLMAWNGKIYALGSCAMDEEDPYPWVEVLDTDLGGSGWTPLPKDKHMDFVYIDWTTPGVIYALVVSNGETVPKQVKGLEDLPFDKYKNIAIMNRIDCVCDRYSDDLDFEWVPAEKAEGVVDELVAHPLAHKHYRVKASMNEDCRSLLHVAASSAHPKVVKILSSADPSVTGINSADEEGWAPLHSASSSGNVEIVEILLSSGADVNLKNDGGRTALYYAASKGWLKIVEILLSHGAKINLKDKASSTGNSELCELLIEEGAEKETQLGLAAQSAHPGIFSLLIVASECILLLVALLLIRHRANVDVEDKEGYTVLGRASVDLRPILNDAAKAMLEE